jgi:mRNA deadenylase 3'-5' endonuclease subunit Ccr4
MLLKYQENKDRLVKMTSVFSKDDLQYTNVTEYFKGIIDYMFYEESPRVQVKSLYTLKDGNSVQAETALPNSVFPSDHLPLICTFGLTST